MAAELSIIDSLPLPSTIDLPPLGQLPSLPPAVTVVGISSEPSSSILNPLPPPLPLDTYDTQYGPSSPSEPQLDPPILTPPDGEFPSFDEVNDQYDFLRRTLSHSRGRYSARYKRPRPKPKPKEEDSDEQSSLDMPGKKREDSATNESPYKIKPPGKGPHPLAKRHTVQGSNNVRRDLAQSKTMEQRRSSPATVRAKHVDSLGRNYVIDHQTHTVQYGSPSEGSENIHFTGRREMLNRRYESLQRSFRSAHHHRRIQTNNNLSPGETAGAISYLPGERQESSEEVSVTSPVTRGSKKEQKSEKKSRWFGFGRRSNRSISQTTPDPQEDNIIPIASPSSIISPITPPPSLDDLEISLPPPLTPPQPVVMPNGGLESSVGVSEPGQGNGNGRNRDSVTAILDAMSTTQPRPQSTHTQEQEEPEAVAAPLSSPTHRATDIDKIAETQRRISRTKRQRRPRTDDGGDTDEETDILSPRISVTSNDRPGSATGGERGATPGSTDSGSREERTQPTTSDSTTGEKGGDEVGVATKEEEEEEGDPQSFTRQRVTGSKRKMSKGLMESPALKFITRPDLYTFLNSSGEAGEEFFSNRALVELVQRIRSQTNLFEKYQHSRQLVKTLNKFADTESELPDGWEKKLNKQGRIFFIDHDNCLTTFIDPRLPLDSEQSNIRKTSSISAPQSVRRVYSVSEEPELRPHHTTVGQSMSVPSEPAQLEETTTERASYESQIVAFLRQPNVIDKINRRYGRGVKPHLAEAIEDIQQSGIPGLERIQLAGGTAAYELGLILSIFDEEVNSISPQQQQNTTTPNITVTSASSHPDGAADDGSTLQRQKQAFSAKLQTFKLQLARLGFAQSSRLKFNLRRDHLLEDAYEHIMKSEIRHLQRKRLNIAFKGEEGLDYGGPSREFFFLVSREIFNPYFGLFEYSANDTYTVQISSTSCFIRNNLDWLRFAGRIIGLTIAQGFLLDVFFTRPFYKLLLKRPPTLKDLESLEPSFYSSLLWIKENDPAPLDLTFSVEEEAFGQLTTHELKEGGLDIPVLEENKTEYIDLMLKWRLDRGTQEQSAALMKGFNEIMPVSLIQQFDAQELEFIIAGTLEIDIDDWRANTDYRNGYNANHPVVLWFWKAVEMFDNEQRLRLLQFITGTSSVPYEGFKALRGSSGPKRFTIDFFNDIRSLPRSHTCFNRLDLPPYPSFEILYEKLRVAIEEGGTFGVE